jgi:gamma-glutamylcyclotransferase (GGCT)/AIG2-like uncharacterized protein YtfP
MANRHYPIKEEFEVTIKVKVRNIKISTYEQLNELQQADNTKDFKQEISNHLKQKLNNSYYQQEVTDGVDWWSFEVE